FVNTLVLRLEVGDDPEFRQLLGRVRETCLGAYGHQDVPFEMVVEALAPARDLSHTPLFQVLLALNNAPRAALQLPGLRLEGLEEPAAVARFDVTLELWEEEDGGLGGSLEYNRGLFEAARMERLAGYFVELLGGAVREPERRVSELQLLGERERTRLLREWNGTAAVRPEGMLAHELVERQAAERPRAAALEFEERCWSYGELNGAANRLAHSLIARGIGRGGLVALELQRSAEMVVALLGVLKAGAAYVPVDPAYPLERRRYMLEDSRAALKIDRGWLEQEAQAIAGQADSNPKVAMSAEELAYVIYTSGSTGKPKGVMLAHRGLVNLALWQKEAFGIGEGSRVLQFAPYSFDASVWEMFMALSHGATLLVARQERLASMEELHGLLSDTTAVTLPPAVLGALPSDGLAGLRTVVAAGEACGRELVEKWGPGRQFCNAYGPTETTVCASMVVTRAGESKDPSIGGGIANTRLYVLDEHLELAPSGVSGELCVGGVCLARGYLNRPELTAERFIPDAYGEEPGGRLYRTGDMVRWREGGELEYVGRQDEQVKVRGFRIELGEVEAGLKALAGVHAAAVEALGQRLVAWVAGDAVPEPAALREQLGRSLPAYMLPTEFIVMPA
ncbi:MAG TPA: amino acid adenylation domain-containing protein, partial [bacterium]|nr:amino acid adenylation domain-containing protein [bacterium]